MQVQKQSPSSAPVHRVADSLHAAARVLADVSESPRLDAELLLGKVMGISRTALRIRDSDLLAADHESALSALIARRVRGVPVAYLTECREFWSLDLRVTPDVLVPRPETEVLVEQVLGLLPGQCAGTLLDLGTGSGAIALALASERPRLRVPGVDVSAQALSIAAHNARTLGLPQIEWLLGSWFAPVAGRRFDVIAANPPYLAAGDAALEALTAEPRSALTSGPSGLEALTQIAAAAAAHLSAAGWLMLEHGSQQGDAVARLLEHHGFSRVHTVLDYGGLPRVTLGTLGTIPHLFSPQEPS